LRTFGKATRTKEEIDATEVNFNEILGINNYTMANESLTNPFINCVFITDE